MVEPWIQRINSCRQFSSLGVKHRALGDRLCAHCGALSSGCWKTPSRRAFVPVFLIGGHQSIRVWSTKKNANVVNCRK